MAPGERAAFEGILAMLRPSLAVEIGTAAGGSLERISAYSREVHAFDLERHPNLTSERFPNVSFHFGDSHELLPEVLDGLAEAGKNIEFALVDGDHSAAGARQDLEDLLRSPAVGETLILLHDTLNERVRSGFEQVPFDAFDKVRFVDLDFVPGRVLSEGPIKDELWSGLGMVLASRQVVAFNRPRAYPSSAIYAAFSASLTHGQRSQSGLGHGQLVELERELEACKGVVRQMERSLSWRLTAPLRSARGIARRLSR